MIIDFKCSQLQKFDDLAQKIVENPECYIQFDSVSDFYKVEWLADFPVGTQWFCSGLDDGAEFFDIVIQYQNHQLNISVTTELEVQLKIRDEM